MMRLSAEEQAFQKQVRAFIRDNLPADIKYKVDNNLLLKKDDHVRWQKILGDKGWFAGGWPEQYGGAGWSETQQYIFDQENALAGAPFIIPYGVNMVGPVLYNFGTEEQKEKYLPGILSNDTWWTQGYSEPNAGSDLASLKCSARREGDEYVINGTKMWTTQAQYADMMHILVRTDDGGKKQEGITFLVLDMNTPGITISPIITIDGVYHTNQTFFDEVRVPVANRVGDEGDGWKIARFLLEHERTAIADTGAKSRGVAAIKQRLQVMEQERPGQPQNLLFKMRLAEIESELTAVIALEQRLIADWQAGKPVGYGASALKVRATELQQSLSVLIADLNGPYKAAYEVDYVDQGKVVDDPTPSQLASGGGYLYLYGRCASIYGGSNQVQRNIIAKMVLG
ncbi:acyl-CoA dehydrogenase family protein [Pseudomaricurvus alkylphenolicus]|jgi:alkylation response protein AidB-like acyl-CoA dehydrogenase|uniref:acyl-CoA dehydrogenase family protein n=1 Tax=Pseudomaricurvus alkylphenolicus TaxID=1306991 RepID=UPI0019812C73|nr:acyl-CoA dehydrogenase family protein [Pseudomaricurvus alkylphenolicus]